MDDCVDSAEVCPTCGAAYSLTGQRCWMCGELLPEPAARPTRSAPLRPFVPIAQNTFSLSSLFLVMTLAAVCLGAFAAAPGLGVLLAIVATPALVRTIFVSSRRKQIGERLTPGQKTWAFAGAFGVVAVTFVAASAIAFLAVCGAAASGFALNMNLNVFLGLGALVGGVLGICVIVGAFRLFWGPKPPPWFSRLSESRLARSKLARVFLVTFIVGSLVRFSSESHRHLLVPEVVMPIVLVGILVGWLPLTSLIIRRSAPSARSSLLATALAALAFILLLTATAGLVFVGGSWLGHLVFRPLWQFGGPSDLAVPFAAACAATADYWLFTRLWPTLTRQKG